MNATLSPCGIKLEFKAEPDAEKSIVRLSLAGEIELPLAEWEAAYLAYTSLNRLDTLSKIAARNNMAMEHLNTLCGLEVARRFRVKAQEIRDRRAAEMAQGPAAPITTHKYTEHPTYTGVGCALCGWAREHHIKEEPFPVAPIQLSDVDRKILDELEARKKAMLTDMAKGGIPPSALKKDVN